MNLLKRFLTNSDDTNRNLMDYRPKIQQWTCNYCTFSANEVKNKVCEVCRNNRQTQNDSNIQQQQQQEPKIWKCKICTLVNIFQDIKCQVCDSPRETTIDLQQQQQNDSVIILDDENNYETIKNGWICKQCTFINNKSNDTCDICGVCNDIIRNERITTAKMWTCVKCSSNNRNIKSIICEVCGYNTQTSLFNRQNSTLDNNNSNYASLDTSMQSLRSSRAQQSMAINDIYMHSIEEALQLWRNIVDYCQKYKHKFIDDGFPPCDKSLFSDEKSKEKILGRKIRAIQWLHPEQIRVRSEDSNYKWTVYLKNPSFHDIKQGHLGNCWFLSALAVILDRPEIIQKILVANEFCPEGMDF
jgi:hypothetical protein